MCSKIGYKSFGKAFNQMQVLNRNKGFDIKRAYKCPECNKWHHTSMSLADYVQKH